MKNKVKYLLISPLLLTACGEPEANLSSADQTDIVIIPQVVTIPENCPEQKNRSHSHHRRNNDAETINDLLEQIADLEEQLALVKTDRDILNEALNTCENREEVVCPEPVTCPEEDDGKHGNSDNEHSQGNEHKNENGKQQ